MSNARARHQSQIQQVMYPGLAPLLVGILSKTDVNTWKEYVWTVINYGGDGIVKYILYFICYGKVEPWMNLLTGKDIIFQAPERLDETEELYMTKECVSLDKIEAF